MSNKLIDQMTKFKNATAKKQPADKKPMSGYGKDIWHTFQDGENRIRLVGNFLQVKGHFLAPNDKGWRGLCPKTAFFSKDSKDNKNKIAQMVACADFDVETGEMRKENKVCVSCALNKIAYILLGKYKKKELTDTNEKFYDNLRQNAGAKNNVKWNIIDRDNPLITHVEFKDDKKIETKKPGLKISTIPLTAFDNIFNVATKLEVDLTDPIEGVDLIVIKSQSGGKTSYSCSEDYDKKAKGPKFIRLTDEELTFVQHDLKKRCAEQTEQAKVLNALHPDLQALIEEYQEELAKGNFKVGLSAVSEALKEQVGYEEPSNSVTVQVTAPKPSAVVTPPKEESTDTPTDVDDVKLDGDFGDFETENDTL